MGTWVTSTVADTKSESLFERAREIEGGGGVGDHGAAVIQAWAVATMQQ